MAVTRRDLLAASAAMAMAPAFSRRAFAAALPREADIVVIGAGAAGIAAARRIQAANRKVIVVEADTRLGGRCWTDSNSFDVPFDRGARWLHNPDTNPMVRLARSCRARHLGGTAGPENPRRPALRARQRNRGISGCARSHQPRHRRGLTQGPTSPALPCCRKILATGQVRRNSCSAPTARARTSRMFRSSINPARRIAMPRWVAARVSARSSPNSANRCRPRFRPGEPDHLEQPRGRG